MEEKKLRYVRDLMTVGVPTCKHDSLIVDIARLLVEKNFEGLCVLDEEGNGIGLVSNDELLLAYGRENAHELTAEEVMREGMPTLQPDLPLEVAAQMMRDLQTRIAYLPHNAAGIIYPAAYITSRHFIRHLAAQDPQELRDIGIEAERKSPLEQFVEKRDAARRRAQDSKKRF
ncbi:MAG: CBS domain-containing protein [Anaerolineales bacterium]|nr:CBS domain-containing protein [Anaerolineales bacterium]